MCCRSDPLSIAMSVVGSGQFFPGVLSISGQVTVVLPCSKPRQKVTHNRACDILVMSPLRSLSSTEMK